MPQNVFEKNAHFHPNVDLCQNMWTDLVRGSQTQLQTANNIMGATHHQG